jgi:SAM-dependent methyltransferase
MALKDDRTLKMKYVEGQPKVSDEEYVNLMKQDWDARSDKDATLYTMAVSGANDTEIKNSGLRDYNVLFLPEFAKSLKGISKGRVLEYGCGLGRMTEFISKVAKSVDAVDISSKNIFKARERLKNFRNVQFFTCNGKDLKAFGDAKYDFIYSYIVFQHIGSKSVITNILKEFVRLLDKGGRMRLQFRDVPIPMDDSKGNTWHGSQIGLSFIRPFAEEHGLTLESHQGEGTEYFWVTLIKG